MKQVLITILFAGLLSACCTKKECLTAFDLGQIELRSYEPGDIDSVWVSEYEQGSAFTNAIDSGFAQISESATGFYLFLPVDLKPDSDYKLEFLEDGTTFEITEIKTGEQKCNSCLFKKDTETALESYIVNGVLRTENYFYINK